MERCSYSVCTGLYKTNSYIGYRRTVLIIWPDAKDCNVRFGGHNFNLALKKISEPEISESIRSKILDYLLREASIDIAGVANAVSSFALSKHDLELWNRCIRACGTTNGFCQFKSQTLIEAANMFGFVNVKHRYVTYSLLRIYKLK